MAHRDVICRGVGSQRRTEMRWCGGRRRHRDGRGRRDERRRSTRVQSRRCAGVRWRGRRGGVGGRDRDERRRRVGVWWRGRRDGVGAKEERVGRRSRTGLEARKKDSGRGARLDAGVGSGARTPLTDQSTEKSSVTRPRNTRVTDRISSGDR